MASYEPQAAAEYEYIHTYQRSNFESKNIVYSRVSGRVWHRFYFKTILEESVVLYIYRSIEDGLRTTSSGG